LNALLDNKENFIKYLSKINIHIINQLKKNRIFFSKLIILKNSNFDPLINVLNVNLKKILDKQSNSNYSKELVRQTFLRGSLLRKLSKINKINAKLKFNKISYLGTFYRKNSLSSKKNIFLNKELMTKLHFLKKTSLLKKKLS
jgi:hypothetical protein